MKTVLILVLSSEIHPYPKMMETAQNTWDSIEVNGCETAYYCGKSDKLSTDNVRYLNVRDTLLNMGHKTLAGLEWALANRGFDYIARVHSSCYVDKKRLIEYVQTLPAEGVYSGVEATSQNGFQYLWGGGHFILSKDVVHKIVDNRNHWHHEWMEDESMSHLCTQLNIPFHAGKSCSINKRESDWLLLGYGGESKEFTNFADVKTLGNHFYRVKCDADRSIDKFVMNELFKVLK